MKQKLFAFLRPRLALLLAAALMATMLPVLPLTASAAGPTQTWEEREEIKDKSFEPKATTLTSYTYYDKDGNEETVTVNSDTELGSKENPISISSEVELILFGKQISGTSGKYYILDKPSGIYDMDGETYSMLPLMAEISSGGTAAMTSPERAFEGILIGNGASITNAYIVYSSDDSDGYGIGTNLGLFGALQGSETAACQVMDLNLSVTLGEVTEPYRFSAGGLAALTEGNILLQNVTVTAAMTGEYRNIGGLLGYVNGPIDIRNCHTTLRYAGNESSLSARYSLGGLIGSVENETDATLMQMTGCTATVNCDCKSGNSTGGLAGSITNCDATITDCTAQVNGTVTGDYIGGAIGDVIDATVSLNGCDVTVTQNMCSEQTSSEYISIGALLGLLYSSSGATSADFSNCAAKVPVAKSYDGQGYPKGPIGTVSKADWNNLPDPTFSYDEAISVLELGNDITLELVNGTTLDTATVANGVLTVTDTAGNSSEGDTNTASVTVGANGSAALVVSDETASPSTTYNLTGVNGTLRLEDRTTDTPAAYYVTVDADFTDNSSSLHKGDRINLLDADDKVYTVYFDSQGGSAVDSVTVSYGQTIAAPTDPDKDNCIFDGWYKEAECTTPWTFESDKVTASTTLYAKWLYTVTLNDGGGTGASGGGTYGAGEPVTINAGSRSGYNFAGWTSTDVTFANASSATTTFTMPAKAVTVTANWTAIPTTPSGPSYDDDDDDYTPPATKTEPELGNNGGWDEIQDELTNLVNDLNTGDLKPGETVTVEMNGATEVPKEVLKEIAGKDITVEFEMEGGVTWAVNGADIPANIGDLNLGVSTGGNSIPVNVINNVTGEKSTVQLELSHNGPFGATLHLSVDLGDENRGFWANLYYFNEALKQLVFHHASRIDSSGKASWPFDHASSYAIVIDTENHDPEWENPFTDVKDSDWFYSAVEYVNKHGLMAGTSTTLFSPDATTSRGMVAKILYRQEGESAVSGTNPFTDVSSGAYYHDAIIWAAQNGIVGGYGGGLYGPDDPITREQLAAILWRYAQYKGWDVSVGESTNILSYKDFDKISEYAIPAMQWACGAGIMGGYDGNLMPADNAKRSHAAVMLTRFFEDEE